MVGTLLSAPALDVYGQMALDEAVLDRSVGEALVLRFYDWGGGNIGPGRPAGATFGYFQRHEEAVAGLKARGLAVHFPVARRPTGGGLVVHDGDLTFSLVFPWARLASPALVYKDMHRGVHLGLKAVGLASRLWSPGSQGAVAIADCFSGPSPMDLVHEDGRKFLGGALRRRKGMGLYQGSMRVEGFEAPRERLRRAVLDGLSLEWSATLLPADADDRLLDDCERLRSGRYATDDWNRRR